MIHCPFRTLVELDGEVTELQALQSVAPTCDCAITPGPGDELCWLSGTKIEAAATPQAARDEASKILVLLNGLARLENPEHHNVDLADYVFQSNRPNYCAAPGWRRRAGSKLFMSGEVVAPPVDPAVECRRNRLLSDPKLVSIVEAFDEEISWQRLRVAFERVRNLVGSDNAFVRDGYASAQDLASFKANVEDPRHSGVEAVHGVPNGPLKGEKMTKMEGYNFVVRLLNTFFEKQRQQIGQGAPMATQNRAIRPSRR